MVRAAAERTVPPIKPPASKKDGLRSRSKPIRAPPQGLSSKDSAGLSHQGGQFHYQSKGERLWTLHERATQQSTCLGLRAHGSPSTSAF